MKKRLRFLMVTMGLVFMNLAGSVLYAQSPQTIEVGPHFGGTAYIGDLNVWRNLKQWDWKSLKQFHYDFGAVVRYNYDTRWSFRLDYSHLKVRAGDVVAAWRPQSKLNFKSTINDLSLMVEFNFFDYYTGKNDKGVSPYIFAGVSGLMYHVQPFTGNDTWDTLYLNGFDSDEEDLFTVDDKRIGHQFALSVPFGVGCKISISEHLATTIEWRMHYTLTDHLDGVHGNYPKIHAKLEMVNEQGEAESYDFTDPAGIFPDEGYQRGNARTNDWFGMFNVSLTWKFVLPEKNACKMTE
jgi:hypothetical protein